MVVNDLGTDLSGRGENVEPAEQVAAAIGLVHRTDGLEGARARIEAACSVVHDFGVATECGLGRRPPETIPALLELHAAVAEGAAEPVTSGSSS